MKHSRELFAEFIGTFVVIFVGTGAVMVNTIVNAAITHLGISIVFGAVGNLGATLPRNGDWMQALILETVLTFLKD